MVWKSVELAKFPDEPGLDGGKPKMISRILGPPDPDALPAGPVQLTGQR